MSALNRLFQFGVSEKEMGSYFTREIGQLAGLLSSLAVKALQIEVQYYALSPYIVVPRFLSHHPRIHPFIKTFNSSFHMRLIGVLGL